MGKGVRDSPIDRRFGNEEGPVGEGHREVNRPLLTHGWDTFWHTVNPLSLESWETLTVLNVAA